MQLGRYTLYPGGRIRQDPNQSIGASHVSFDSTTNYLTYLSLLVIDHDIVWLDVSVHDTLAVTKV